MNIELWDYQKDIINNARKALESGFMSPLVVSPTGSGKTYMFSDIAKKASVKGKTVYILVHKKEILEQTKASLFSMGVVTGQVASGKPMTRDNIQVAMVGTLVHRLNDIPNPDLFLIDEAHHSVAGQWQKILKKFPNIPRIGWTATPERLDGVGLGDIFDTMILGPSIAELVAKKFLAYPILKTPEKERLIVYKMRNGDFDKDQQFAHMSDKVVVGDVIDNYREHFDGLPAITFCANLEHCYDMEKHFLDANIKAMVVQGNMKKSDRERAIKGLADGTFNTVLSCNLISEGVDVPVLAGTIHLRRTQSLSLWMQQFGRGLRKYPGKDHAIILDHAGNYYLHGHPLDEQNWSLYSEKRNIKKADPSITRCPSCYAVWPGKPRKCLDAACGFELNRVEIKPDETTVPQNVEGQLRDVLPGTIDDAEFKTMSKFITDVLNYDPQLRKRAMMAKAAEIKRNAQDEESARDKIAALAKQVGYKDTWTRWAWMNLNRDSEIVGGK